MNKTQVQQIVNLLHEDYRDCKVQIIKSKSQFIKWKIVEIVKLKFLAITHRKDIWNHIKIVLSKEVDGCYDSTLKTAQVYQLNISEDCRDLYTTLVLFHELRHHYQNKHGKLERHDIEKDCDRFSWRMYDRHYTEIKKILEIDLKLLKLK